MLPPETRNPLTPGRPFSRGRSGSHSVATLARGWKQSACGNGTAIANSTSRTGAALRDAHRCPTERNRRSRYRAGAVPCQPRYPSRPPLAWLIRPLQSARNIRVYGHNNLFYWWPIWAARLPFGGSHLRRRTRDGDRAARHAGGAGRGRARHRWATARRAGRAGGADGAGRPVPKTDDPSPRLHVAANNNYGVVFVGAILFVIIVTNLTLRGMASIIAIGLFIIAGLFVALMGWWDDIFAWLGGLDVRMNAGGYLAVAIPLLVIWLFSTFVYDHYTYLIVSRGRCRSAGRSATANSRWMHPGCCWRRSGTTSSATGCWDWARGDLHVKTGTPSNLDFDLPNVLFIGWKLAQDSGHAAREGSHPQRDPRHRDGLMLGNDSPMLPGRARSAPPCAPPGRWSPGRGSPSSARRPRPA